MNLTLPDRLEDAMRPQHATLLLAIGMFVAEEATLGQAAEIAGLTQAQFLRELGSRHIPLHYDTDDFDADLHTLRELKLL